MRTKIFIILSVGMLILSGLAGMAGSREDISEKQASFPLLLAQSDDSREEASPEEEERHITRGDFFRIFAATDFIKEKINNLLSWSIGYDITKIASAKLVPTIRYLKATPIKVPPDGRTVIEIEAQVDDPHGLKNIEFVSADLSSIGRLPNSILVDSGMWGDRLAGDGIFTLQTSVAENVEKGAKEISISVSNKKGWLALARTSIDVKLSPSIIEAKASPASVTSSRGGAVVFFVRVDNPGRIEDITSVSIDLDAVGGRTALMRNDGKDGDEAAMDDVFSYRYIVPAGLSLGEKRIPVKVQNIIGGRADGEILLTITQ